VACVPLNIQNGLFVPSSWSSALNTPFNGGTVTYAPGGANPGITVQKGSGSVFHAQLANRALHYMVLGNEFVLILDVETGIGPSTRNVSLVNFATFSEVNVLTVLASSNSVGLPFVAGSPGNGSVFLAFGEDGTQLTSVAIYRSSDATVLCSLGAPIIATGQTTAEATTTSLIIHYTVSSGSQNQVCPKPVGTCSVSPASQSFPDVFVGGCPFTPPTKQFTVRNSGSDCLTVNSITDVAPFSKQSTSRPLPVTLGPNETVQVTIEFNPTAPGNHSSVPLPLSTTPANGANQLLCSGNAQAAQFRVGFSATTINFDTVQVGATQTRQLTITNTGSKPLPVTVPPLTAAGFSCAGFNGTLNCGQAQPIAITFTPTVEGQEMAWLEVGSSASATPQQITLIGVGCIPNAVISVPPVAPISFGQVQRGFRTVRIFEVDNTGDGSLTFNGAISGPAAALFGLPDPQGSVNVTPATRAFSALPTTPCGGGGPAGSGKTLVAISFFAVDPPGMVNATLTLSGHNATNVPPAQTWVFPLTAEITPPVALDVASVVDHSGSMSDPLGSRVKMDAAVSASQLLVQLLRPDLEDRVSLVRFNHQPEVIDAITPVSSASAPTQTTILQDVQTRVPPPIGATAIAGGALTGIAQLQTARPGPAPPLLNQALIVLTDGQENTGYHDASGSWYSILGGPMDQPPPSGSTVSPGTVNTSPMPRPAGIKIYAIGVGRDADIDPTQLGALAGDPNRLFRVDQDLTGTRFFQLEKYYTQIFMDIVGTSPVLDPMYWISNGQTHEIEFDVLRGDVDALVVVYDWEGMRLPFYCVSPSGEVLDPSSIPAGYQLRSGVTNETRFLQFKTPLRQPNRYAGRWKVVIHHPGRVCFGPPPRRPKKRGFVSDKCREHSQPVLYGIAIGVGSNFRMAPYLTPAPVYTGDMIQLNAVVSEAGLPIAGCDVAVEATAPDGSVQSLHLADDGSHGDGSADDGDYGATYTRTYVDGTYHFLFRAVGVSRDGKPVSREAVRDKPVLARKRRTDDGHDGGSQTDCCIELLHALREQTDLLRELLDNRTR
jgi:hypothetical protein